MKASRRCRLAAIAAGWVSCFAWAASLAGCSSDLFHDTSWPSVCDFDPTTPGCDGAEDSHDAGDGGGDAGAGSDAGGADASSG